MKLRAIGPYFPLEKPLVIHHSVHYHTTDKINMVPTSTKHNFKAYHEWNMYSATVESYLQS